MNGRAEKLSPGSLDSVIRDARVSQAALENLLVHYAPFLRLLAEQSIGAALRRREDASDIVQQTMIEATTAFAQFKGHSEPEFTGWLKQILRRNVANCVRDNFAAKRDLRLERYLDQADTTATITWFQPAAHTSSPSVQLIRAERALELAHALESLPDEQRLAVRMRHVDGQSLQEISAALHKTPASVAGLIRRGVRRLREALS